MSKQSEAKLAQSYEAKPTVPTCGNCAHLVFDMKPPAWMQKKFNEGHVRYTQGHLDRNKRECAHRCGIGGFAVKKTGTCKQWNPKA